MTPSRVFFSYCPYGGIHHRIPFGPLPHPGKLAAGKTVMHLARYPARMRSLGNGHTECETKHQTLPAHPECPFLTERGFPQAPEAGDVSAPERVHAPLFSPPWFSPYNPLSEAPR